MKKVIAIILAVAIFMMAIPLSFSAESVLDDNKVLFAVTDDPDGKLSYGAAKGLGWTQAGILKQSNGIDYTTKAEQSYLFADEIDGEMMWKIDFNVNKDTGGHVKSSGGGTYIYPFYSSHKDENGNTIPEEDMVSLGDKIENADRYTHMAVRIKLVDDGTGRAVEGATRSISLNPLGPNATDGMLATWKKSGKVYFQDINTGEKIHVKSDTINLPLGFDGYVVFPSETVVGKVDGKETFMSLSEFIRLHIMVHWNCTNHGARPTTDSWVGTELYIGDMILTKNIDSFNLIYGAPTFELESNDTSVTVISDDSKALYALSSNANEWLTREEINAQLKNLPKETEYTRAATEHAKLDGLVPYSLVRGNHDKTAGFNAAFNKAPYNTSYSGSFDGKIENTWRELVVGKIKYLIFTLDIGPSDEVLEWAGEVIEDHPYHNVIITTHVYLDKAGTPMDSSYNSASTNSTYGGGGNDAEDMWDKLIGKYENIVMVLCGHFSANTAVTTTRIGEHGNKVTQMLIDPQGVDNAIGGTGMITMLNFSENGTKVSVETYSTAREMYFISQGQYEITVPVTEFVEIKGDISGNGICDSRDLAIVRKTLMNALSIDELNIDVNLDGKKDVRDIVALKRVFIS